MADVTQSFYNIESDGGMQQGADITDVLQNAVNFITNKTTIYIPGKWYSIRDTITFPNVIGGTVYGAGFGVAANAVTGDGSNRNTARLIWIGDKNKPMFKLTGTNLTFDGGLTLIGKHQGQTAANRCSIGILVTKGVGIGTGKTTFNNIMFRDFDVMFQCGLDWTDRQTAQQSGESNNDNLVFNFFATEGACNSVYRMNNLQSMKHNFNFLHCKASASKIFDIRGGGLVYVKGGLSFGTNFLHFSSDNIVGSNSAIYNICNMKVDSQGESNFKAVVMDRNTPAKVIFDKLFTAYGGYYANNKTMFDLMGRCALTLRDCEGMQRQTISPIYVNTNKGDHIPNILLDRCFMDDDMIRITPGQSKYYLSVKYCYKTIPGDTGGAHEPIDDFKEVEI